MQQSLHLGPPLQMWRYCQHATCGTVSVPLRTAGIVRRGRRECDCGGAAGVAGRPGTQLAHKRTGAAQVSAGTGGVCVQTTCGASPAPSSTKYHEPPCRQVGPVPPLFTTLHCPIRVPKAHAYWFVSWSLHLACRKTREVTAAQISVQAANERYTTDVKAQVRRYMSLRGGTVHWRIGLSTPVTGLATSQPSAGCCTTDSELDLLSAVCVFVLLSVLPPQGRLAAEAEAHARNTADLQRFVHQICAQAGADVPANGGRPACWLVLLLAGRLLLCCSVVVSLSCQCARCALLLASGCPGKSNCQPMGDASLNASPLPRSPASHCCRAASQAAAVSAFKARLADAAAALQAAKASNRQVDDNLGRGVDQVGRMNLGSNNCSPVSVCLKHNYSRRAFWRSWWRKFAFSLACSNMQHAARTLLLSRSL
jgi:hypothetical protein